MEFRKIISFGKSSYVVSLPKHWIEKHHLGKGDSLILEESTQDIILKARESSKPVIPEKKVIQVHEKDLSRIRSEIIVAYLSGYDIIKVIGSNINKHANAIKEVLNNLTGIELLEQDDTKIVAKNLLNPEEISIPILIRRMDNMIRAMFNSNIEKQGETDLQERDIDVNRLFYLITRVMHMALENPQLLNKLGLNHVELQKNIRITRYLESLGDHMKRINRNM